MNELAASTLASLISRYGTSVALDPFRCEALLRDTCPRCSREIFVLVHAVRQQVPSDLIAPRHSLPPALFRGFLVKRLQDELSFSEDAARWAVDTWAAALGRDNGEKNSTGPVSAGNLSDKLPAPAGPLPSRTTPDQRSVWARDLESPDQETRLRTIRQIRNYPDDESIRLLISALENPGWRDREAAFDALLDLGDAAVPALTEALNDLHENVVTCAILLLGAARARSATEALLALLDTKWQNLTILIWALGEIGDQRSLTRLGRFVGSSNPEIRQEAEAALKKFA